MKESLIKILGAKIDRKLFIISLTLGFLFTSLLYILIIPLAYWGLFGEGEAAANIMDRPLNSFILEFCALTLTLCIYAALAFMSFRNEKFNKAKSYILAVILIFVIYMFRFEVGNALIDLNIK
ncbi:hypothetical protein [Sphingobacterium corticibacter]|nr:hypothetical protein [Sphingobacterium corticibacter]